MVDLLCSGAAVSTDRLIVERGNLAAFFRTVWRRIDPARLIWNWHLEEMCAHLEAVSLNQIQRLIINVPPGFGKSNAVNVIWNVWEWIKRPATKFLFASFDAGLVGTRDGGKIIRLLASEWFRTRWGDLLEKGGKPSASYFTTLAGGFRFSTSPHGKGTGRHGDIRVIDDPLKPTDAAGGATMTKNALKAVSEWRSNTWESRATDQRTVRDVLIMQRLHDEDLAGEAIAEGGWTHLNLPMILDDEPCRTKWGGDRRTRAGDLLFEERFPWPVVERMRDTTLGPDVFAAQCQQKPVRKGGGIFERAWWRFYHVADNVPEPCLCDECWKSKGQIPGHHGPRLCKPLPYRGSQSQSWVCTFKKTDTADFVAGGVLKTYLDDVFMLALYNKRASFTQTVQAIKEMSMAWPHAYDKLIEDKANGPAVENALMGEIPGITLITPMGGKEARANAGSIFMSGGHFHLPHPDLAPWTWDVLYQHEGFPKAKNDDIVDVVSQFLVNVRKYGVHFAAAMKALRGEK